MTAFSLDPRRTSSRIVAGRALVVARADGRLHRLDRAGTEIWRLLEAAAPAALDAEAMLAAIVAALPGSSSPGVAMLDAVSIELFLCDLELAGLVRSDGAPPSSGRAEQRAERRGARGETARSVLPRHDVLTGAWELVDEIEPSSAAIARRVGEGWLLRAPDGELFVAAAEAATIWDSLKHEPRTFVALLDALCDRGLDAAEARSRLSSLLLAWHDQGMIRGLERVDHLRRRLQSAATEGGLRSLGRLDTTTRTGPLPAPPRLGSSPTLRDPAAPGAPGPEHVAIVCQYGIQDLAPGVEPYTQRCIALLHRLGYFGAPVDLVILAGGGRHGRSELREAESVIDRYRALLPEPALWVEKHSATTWENLQWSLEMLEARGIVPRRISFLGDRARIEKLRVACWIARRRFASMRGVAFRAVPITRPRFTWRDNRAVQIVVGSAQILKESRERRPATDGASV